MSSFKIGDRVQVQTNPSEPYVFTGVVVDISTLHSFLKVKSDATGLEQWHQAEWCSLL